jgi:hypothetical protein
MSPLSGFSIFYQLPSTKVTCRRVLSCSTGAAEQSCAKFDKLIISLKTRQKEFFFAILVKIIFSKWRIHQFGVKIELPFNTEFNSQEERRCREDTIN